MTSIKLEEKSIELNGRTYVLRMNMSVLDRILQVCDGEVKNLLEKSVYDSSAITVAAMLNDYAEDQGWDQDWTDRKVKKIFNPAIIKMLDVTGMFYRAMTPEKKANAAPAVGPKTEDKKPDEDSGN